MTKQQIEKLAHHGLFRQQKMEPEWVETHISWVLFTKDFVFKIKKPVKLPFLDFSSQKKRRFYCEEELRLNRRFSDIYLGICSIERKNEKILPGKFNTSRLEEAEPASSSNTLDYAVIMKRMPDAMRLDRLIEQDGIKIAEAAVIGQRLAEIHQLQSPEYPENPENIHLGHFEEMTAIQSDLIQLYGSDYAGECQRAVQNYRKFLAVHKMHLHQRVKAGFFRDLHGDLHTQNIFYNEQPIFFDCIEFSTDLRILDVMDELAFLFMDTHYNGHIDLAEVIKHSYLKTHPIVQNHQDETLFNFYCGYRASVRAKVLSIKVLHGDISNSKSSSGPVALKKYLDLMLLYSAGLASGS